jgi:hypothetical protein
MSSLLSPVVSNPLNLEAEFFGKWSSLMHNAGVNVRDIGGGMIDMEPDIVFKDEMKLDDRKWLLQSPDADVTWAVRFEVGPHVVNAPCLLAPTNSKGWFELLTKRDLHLPLSPGDSVEIWVHGSWRTTRDEPRMQTIARGRFVVPVRGHSLGSPVFNIFLPGNMLLTLHMAFVADELRAIAASVRARLDDCPFDEDE